MTFLNPSVLWALAAVSIPVIIHIFNLKKTKKIEFSTLMFLKEIQQSKYRKIRLKQLLILLCRIAFIILLVMMFAQPFYNGYLGAGEKARSSVLIILDDSFSMHARGTTGSNFENAKAKISELLGILGPDDELFFTTISQINRLDKNILFKGPNSLRDSLQVLKTSDVTKSLDEVLYFANEILKSASNSYREVFLFTDGQKSFMKSSASTNDGLKTNERTKLNIVLIGNRTANNISIDTVNVVTKIFEKNKPVKIKASLNNHNNYNALNKTVTLNYESRRDEKTIDIPANSTVDVEFLLTPGMTGYAGGNIELSQDEIADDEISQDNRQYFSFFIPEKIPLLIVTGSAGDADYINLALSSSEELMRDSIGVKSQYYELTRASQNELLSHSLNNYKAIVIINKAQFSREESLKLKEYIENGGGVIVYPGSESIPENINTLLNELNIPPVNGKFGDGNISYRFDKIDYSHPVFEGIFKQGSDTKNISTESPDIKAGFNLSAGENAITLISLNNGSSFITEYTRGKGRILLFAVPPDMSSSDYPAKNLFSPITVRSILYLANMNSIKPAITGRDYFVTAAAAGSNDSIIILQSEPADKQTGEFIIQQQENLLNMKNFTGTASLYSLRQKDGEILLKFPANFSKYESQTALTDAGETEKIIKENMKLEANIIRHSDAITASVTQLRTGRDLWQYFLLAALFFTAAEYFLARSLAKKDKKAGK